MAEARFQVGPKRGILAESRSQVGPKRGILGFKLGPRGASWPNPGFKLGGALITNDAQVEIAANKRNMLSKRKRDLLDAAAWVREALVCFAWHCGGLTRFRGVAGKRNRWPQRVPKVCDFQNYDQHRAAVKRFADQTKAATVSRYLSLLTSQPSQAKAFLSSWFNLAEPNTGAVSGVQQTISAIQHDLLGRADNDFYQDPECERAL